MATWSMFSTQDASSPIMEQLIFFHDYSMMIIISITISISYLMIMLMKNKFYNRFMLESQMIEIIWTITPMMILIFMAIPSLMILYMTDEIKNPLLSIKSIGHQWYWSYEYSDFKNIEFDSFMIKEHTLNNFRLLDTDNHMIIPMNLNIRLIVNSSDVIHSWTVPSLGIKIDATPGRINQILLMSNRPGLFYGQCSEICGTNHSFMPIVVESTSLKLFNKWLMSN
uniref:Cytochrome c oxidase subunit 2 n=1 Tax=Gasteruption parvicollarium TaxID=1738629 RepID=A0A2S0AYD9_9HYME|nr:cytochrome c oxidase subunit II [Gasteruption parvicollarium]ALJ93740.1 cytochrome c oxidase subunit II [Gasteruption parvicollarium]